ncbi:hypothetical protein P9112_005581 [Eukaryota sp. TZLM1-RC]
MTTPAKDPYFSVINNLLKDPSSAYHSLDFILSFLQQSHFLNYPKHQTKWLSSIKMLMHSTVLHGRYTGCLLLSNTIPLLPSPLVLSNVANWVSSATSCVNCGELNVLLGGMMVLLALSEVEVPDLRKHLNSNHLIPSISSVFNLTSHFLNIFNVFFEKFGYLFSKSDLSQLNGFIKKNFNLVSQHNIELVSNTIFLINFGQKDFLSPLLNSIKSLFANKFNCFNDFSDFLEFVPEIDNDYSSLLVSRVHFELLKLLLTSTNQILIDYRQINELFTMLFRDMSTTSCSFYHTSLVNQSLSVLTYVTSSLGSRAPIISDCFTSFHFLLNFLPITQNLISTLSKFCYKCSPEFCSFIFSPVLEKFWQCDQNNLPKPVIKSLFEIFNYCADELVYRSSKVLPPYSEVKKSLELATSLRCHHLLASSRNLRCYRDLAEVLHPVHVVFPNQSTIVNAYERDAGDATKVSKGSEFCGVMNNVDLSVNQFQDNLMEKKNLIEDVESSVQTSKFSISSPQPESKTATDPIINQSGDQPDDVVMIGDSVSSQPMSIEITSDIDLCLDGPDSDELEF